MTGKESGLGDNFYVDGFDLSGDIGSLSKIACPMSPLEVTGVNKLAFERIGGKRDGEIDWTAFHNTSVGQEHAVLSTLPTTDRIASYWHTTTLGREVATIIGKQVNYDPTRGTDGSLTFAVQALGNGFCMEWGNSLTAGIRADSTATNGTAFDMNGLGGASTAFGWQAYLHVFGVTGTSVTATIQDSADNVTFAGLTGGGFTAATTTGAQRIAGAGNATVRRYLRIATTGTFSAATFAINFVRNTVAVSF
jgi:hypothetical protein